MERELLCSQIKVFVGVFEDGLCTATVDPADSELVSSTICVKGRIVDADKESSLSYSDRICSWKSSLYDATEGSISSYYDRLQVWKIKGGKFIGSHSPGNNEFAYTFDMDLCQCLYPPVFEDKVQCSESALALRQSHSYSSAPTVYNNCMS
eukprot:1798301-Ditylum_brightwellii.AAC.1